MLHKILFLAGSAAHLQSNNEHREMVQRVQAATQRDRFQLKDTLAARIEDMMQAVAQFKPTIFHFIGGGTPDALHILKEGNTIQPLPNAALLRLFRQHKNHLSIAFFNADHSATQARLVSELGIYAIGMNGAILSTVATRFSTGFYLGLGEGKSIEDAFDYGLIILETEYPDKTHLPTLWKAGKKISEDLAPLSIISDTKKKGLGEEYYLKGKEYFDKQNYEEAVKWYRKSAEQGNSNGQYNLGYMYRNGYGVKEDYTEAVKWYRKSAEQGNRVGQCNLGFMYEKGYGVEKDDIEAVKWYRKSAEQGNSYGQNNLGYMYQNGYGVEKNLYLAINWYQKAARQGHQTAQKNLKNLNETW